MSYVPLTLRFRSLVKAHQLSSDDTADPDQPQAQMPLRHAAKLSNSFIFQVTLFHLFINSPASCHGQAVNAGNSHDLFISLAKRGSAL